ncbi:S41 family peptidase [Longispora sp. NPDC051575]|uniref:S41 family peptidase n=1 Tax=Longispora sp. NPDC051575 TaxID=3154943 RepID=UPI0034281C5D
MSQTLIEDALAILRDKYVFPEKAEEAAAIVEASLAAGEYEGLTEEQLGERLTEQIYAVCADKHLRVRVRAVDLQEAGESDEDADAVWNERQRLTNYGILRTERLDGNIGYIKLRGVTSPGIGGAAIAAAMELVANTEALIFDLTVNRGGDPDGVQMWNSYLFKDSETHLNSIYDAETKHTRDYWTLAHVPGARYLDKPVYLLTSKSTFSGGEEFAYNLQALKRATLIGETTGGGAHPTDQFPVSKTVEITVPVARSVNPVTGTNWEGVGVVPDIALPADEAFAHAYTLALQHVAATSTSQLVQEEAQSALEK